MNLTIKPKEIKTEVNEFPVCSTSDQTNPRSAHNCLSAEKLYKGFSREWARGNILSRREPHGDLPRSKRLLSFRLCPFLLSCNLRAVRGHWIPERVSTWDPVKHPREHHHLQFLRVRCGFRYALSCPLVDWMPDTTVGQLKTDQ